MAPPPLTNAKPDTPFSQLVNYTAIIKDLQDHGITLTDEEQQKLRKICTDELNAFNGNSPVTSDIAATGLNFFYVLMAFVQNLFSGKPLSLDSLQGSFGQATERGKLNQLEQATMRIHVDLQYEGGNLAAAAELISGQHPVRAGGALQDMPSSIMRQIASTLNLDPGTPALLRPQALGLDASGQFPVSAATPDEELRMPAAMPRSRALTQGRQQA